MKRFLYIIIGVTLLLTSCDKETSDNGKLDGFWQITKMIPSKATSSSSDMRTSGITWAFQGHILELRDVNKVHQDIVMSFTREGNKLILSVPYKVDRDADDVLLEDAELLMPYGITHINETFEISELSNERMVLSNVDMYLIFRKY